MFRSIVLRTAYQCVRLYWRIRRPKTYGAKVLLVHPSEQTKVLLVRHVYHPSRWTLPGGGYRPDRETPLEAAKRELKEELGIIPQSMRSLGELSWEVEGKRDHVTLFVATPPTKARIKTNWEIQEVCWRDYREVQNTEGVGTLVKIAIDRHYRKFTHSSAT